MRRHMIQGRHLEEIHDVREGASFLPAGDAVSAVQAENASDVHLAQSSGFAVHAKGIWNCCFGGSHGEDIT